MKLRGLLLLDFSIESGDTVLKGNMHGRKGPTKNAQHTSSQQNEWIGIAEEVLKDSIVISANNSNGFLLLLMKGQIYQKHNK